MIWLCSTKRPGTPPDEFEAFLAVRGSLMAPLVLLMMLVPFEAESRPKRESWSSRKTVEIVRGTHGETSGEVNIVLLANNEGHANVQDARERLPGARYLVPTEMAAQLIVKSPNIDSLPDIRAKVLSIHADICKMLLQKERAHALPVAGLSDLASARYTECEGYAIGLRLDIECGHNAPLGEHVVTVSLPMVPALAALHDGQVEDAPKYEFVVTVYESDRALRAAILARFEAEEQRELKRWAAEDRELERERRNATETEAEEWESVGWPIVLYAGIVLGMVLYSGIGYWTVRRAERPPNGAIGLMAGTKLPPVCVRCGGPATVFKTWRFAQDAGRPGPFSLEVPWCSIHSNHRSSRRLAMGLLNVSGVVAGVFGIWAGVSLGVDNPLLLLAVFASPITISSMLCLHVWRHSVRPTADGSFHVVLMGVAPDYADHIQRPAVRHMITEMRGNR